MDNSKIEWTDATWNPIRGCSRVSEGCRNCYAEKVAKRFSGKGQPYAGLIARTGQWNGNITLVEHLYDQPLRWKRPRRIFVNSMSDLFHENIPFDTILGIFSMMRLAKRHTYQVLTKRPARMLEFFEWARLNTSLVRHFDNVWLGVSVEDQQTADERIPLLLQAPTTVRWISAEPLLGSIELEPSWITRWPNRRADVRRGGHFPLDWVVVGGESGKQARPMHVDWATKLLYQCNDAGVRFFFKQWGEWAPALVGTWYHPIDGGPQFTPRAAGHDTHDFVHGIGAVRIGKKNAGRLLYGRIWDQFPLQAQQLDGAA